MVKLIPKFKIEVWHGANQLYTWNNEAATYIHTVDSLTNAIGTFSLMLDVGGAGGNFKYYDVAVGDIVKIWHGYSSDTFGATPNFYGITSRIEATQNPYLRVLTGKDRGEILLRRLKGVQSWSSVAPHTIATSIASDLGLGTGQIDTDTSGAPISIEIDPDRYETYFNLLRTISDHWYDASNQCKKDFRVDVSNNLIWKARPFSRSGVETLTVGQNIESYLVLRDLESVRNKIYVYGALERASQDKDAFTESLDVDGGGNDWSSGTGSGTVSADGTTKYLGSYSIRHNTTSNDYYGEAVLDIPSAMRPNLNYFPSVNYVVYREAALSRTGYIRLTDDGANTAGRSIDVPNSTEWTPISLDAGKKNADNWILSSSAFNWSVITRCEFFQYFPATGTGSFYIDKLFFNSRNFYGLAEDALISQIDYGIREMCLIDEELRSDGDCAKRAEALLYQLKDPPIRLDITTKGNSNILVGDRLSMTIPAENITTTNFDVVTVQTTIQVGESMGYQTSASMINSTVRKLPPVTKDEVLIRQFDLYGNVGQGAKHWMRPI